jgi:hypothetical protein
MHFFVNYPPPPMPSRESIINEGLKSLEQPKTDQLWLKNNKKNYLQILFHYLIIVKS